MVKVSDCDISFIKALFQFSLLLGKRETGHNFVTNAASFEKKR